MDDSAEEGLGRRFNLLISSYSASDAIAGGLNVVGIVIVLRSLSMAEFGQADFLRVAQWFLGTALGLGVVGGASRLYFESNDPGRRGELMGIALLARASSALIAALILLAVAPALPLIGIEAGWGSILIAAAAIPVFGVMEVLLQTAVNRERPGFYAAIVIVNAAVAVLAIVIFVVLNQGGIEGYLLALLVGQAVAASVGFALQRDQFRWVWHTADYRASIALGAPFVVTGSLQYAFDLFLRGTLATVSTTAILGLYAFAERFAVLVRLVITAAGKTWLPWIFSRHPEPGHDVSAPVRHINGVVLVALCGAIIFVKDLSRLLGGSEYTAAHWAVVLLLLASWVYFLGDWIVSAGLLVAKRPTVRIWIFLAAYGLAAGFATLTVPRWGVEAAATGVLIATTLVLLGMLIASRFIYPLIHGFARLIPASLLVILAAGLGSFAPSLWLRVPAFAGCIAGMWVLSLLPDLGFGARFKLRKDFS